jgi:ligand-binding sensor domain-containing protein/AraC-like DNA-binding protein
MNSHLYRIIAVICVVLTTVRAQAQQVSSFTYSHLGQAEGVCSQRIYSICQTADGALWWTTKKGVERYNGMSIRHYQTISDDKYSLFAGRVVKLHLTLDSRLYSFDSHGNIAVYNEVFDRFEPHTDIAALAGRDEPLNDIMVTDKGIWLAMGNGLFFLQGTTLIPVVKGVYVNTIVQTGYGFLICTRKGVLFYRTPDKRMPTPNMKLPMILTHNIESGYFDAYYNKVWLGGFLQGLQILTLRPDGTFSTSSPVGVAITDPVRSICPYDDKTMLVGIDGMGVYKVTRQPSANGKYEAALLFDANDGKEGVLHGNGIYAVLRDTWGNIVVGSYSGGIDIARPVGSTPAIYQHIRDNRQTLVNDRVNSVAQFANGTFVMGTDDGISLYNPTTHQWTHTCRGTVVLSLCSTPRGTMLASTYGKGVYEVTAAGASRQLYTEQDGVLKDNHVYKLFYDRSGALWMGCLDGDLVKLSDEGGSYYPIKNVQDITQLPDGQIAVATINGIQLISDNGIRQLDYSNKQAGVNLFAQTLYLNDGKELWIGTDGGGVYIYSLKTGKVRQMTKACGIPSNVIYSITKDCKGRMLIATDNGLAFAYPDKPDKATCVNYCYGLEREFSARAVTCLNNNYVLYGTTTGALVINPDNIQKLNYTAKLRITAIDCIDDSPAFKERLHKMLLQRKVRLPYSQRTFDIGFECINLRNQDDIVYRYMVEGGEWSQPTKEQNIRFTNMEPGTNQLLIQAVSRTCGIVLDEVRMTIVVAQPWWNTWWMWMVYVTLIILAFYGAWRVYQLHTKYMRLVLSNPTLTNPKDPQQPSPNTQHPSPSIPDTTAEGTEFIDRVTKLVVDNISNTDFNIDRLCREMAMSRTLFYIKLKTYTGKSPQDFIRIIRLERAATLLRAGQSVMNTAVKTGFDNPKYFSTVFKKYFGVSPSKY